MLSIFINIYPQNFFIVEFSEEESVRHALLSHCQHSKSNKNSNAGNAPIPVYSPFLWFAGNNGKQHSSDLRNRSPKPESCESSSVPIFLPPKSIDSDDELVSYLSQFSTVRRSTFFQFRFLHFLVNMVSNLKVLRLKFDSRFKFTSRFKDLVYSKIFFQFRHFYT